MCDTHAHWFEVLLWHTQDFSCLRSLIQLVHRRRKLLRYLKRTDSAHFQELVRDLSISTPAVQKYPSKKK